MAPATLCQRSPTTLPWFGPPCPVQEPAGAKRAYAGHCARGSGRGLPSQKLGPMSGANLWCYPPAARLTVPARELSGICPQTPSTLRTACSTSGLRRVIRAAGLARCAVRGLCPALTAPCCGARAALWLPAPVRSLCDPCACCGFAVLCCGWLRRLAIHGQHHPTTAAAWAPHHQVPATACSRRARAVKLQGLGGGKGL